MTFALAPARRARAALLAASLCVWSACGGSGDSTMPSAPPQVGRVTISTGDFSLVTGGTRQLSATALTSGGAVVTGASFAWSSSQPAIASVSGTGLVTAESPGTAVVTASSQGHSAAVSVAVILVPVAAVAIQQNPDSAFVGRPFQLRAAATDSAGGSLTGRAFVWTSSDSTVATVNDSGLVVGTGPGNATIVVTCEHVSASAHIVIRTLPTVTLRLPVADIAAGRALLAYVPGGGVTDSVLALSFDSLAAVARRVDDSTVAAVVPASIHGDHVTLALDLPRREGTAAIRVTTAAAPADPAGSIAGSIQAAAALLGAPPSGYPAAGWPADSTALAAAVAAATSAAAALAPDQQLTAATEIAALDSDAFAANRAANRRPALSATPADCASQVSQFGTAVPMFALEIEREAAFTDGVRRVLNATAVARGIQLSGAAGAIQLACSRLTDPSATVIEQGDGAVVSVQALQRAWIASDAQASSTVAGLVQAFGRVTAAYALLQSFGAQPPAAPGLPALVGGTSAVPVSASAVTVVNVASNPSTIVSSSAVNATDILFHPATPLSQPSSFTATLAVSDFDFPALNLSVSGTLPATVSAAVLTVRSIGITPSSVIMQPDSVLALVTIAHDSNGAALPSAGYANAVVWSSSNPAVASVDAAGTLTAHTAGSTTVFATVNGRSGRAWITVQHFDQGVAGDWTGTYALESYDGVPLPAPNSTGSAAMDHGYATLWPSGYFELGSVFYDGRNWWNLIGATGRWSAAGGTLTMTADGSTGLQGVVSDGLGSFAVAGISGGLHTLAYRRTGDAPAEPVRPFTSARPAVFSGSVSVTGTGAQTVFHATLTVTNPDIIAHTIAYYTNCPMHMHITADSVASGYPSPQLSESPCDGADQPDETIPPGGSLVKTEDRAESGFGGTNPFPPGRYYVWILSTYERAPNRIAGGWVTVQP